MIAGKRHRCYECVGMVAHVNSAHVCDRCVKAERRRMQKAHDEAVKRLR